MAMCACCSPEFNNGFWGFKTLLWAALVIASVFITNDVFDTTGYVWVARIGAFVFTIMQQIVLIDLAYRCVSVCVCFFCCVCVCVLPPSLPGQLENFTPTPRPECRSQIGY